MPFARISLLTEVAAYCEQTARPVTDLLAQPVAVQVAVVIHHQLLDPDAHSQEAHADMLVIQV